MVCGARSEAVVDPNNEKAAGSGLTDAVVGPNHAKVVGSKLAEATVGPGHEKALLVLNWLRQLLGLTKQKNDGSELPEEPISPSHAKSIGSGLVMVRVEFEKLELADSEPNLPQLSSKPRFAVSWNLSSDQPHSYKVTSLVRP
ncbi:hypothetical protein F0562_032326 [Nyssa sinensis]|uniref:Uncharacterized protein n=1 Tax=Nyssa sinensis TaxID=561372 RepID=A0A5J5AMR7_9ASTE|nr:hypothetical protein F0562_032326 [Nyssa sinensis]